MALISTCSMDLLMGDANPLLNGTTVHLKGQAVLEASLKKLATLGLDKATSVLLTGETHAGTAAVLAADRVGVLLKTLAPSLKTFKVLPADAMHPRFPSMFSVSMPGSDTLWFDKALMQMAALANISAAVNPACAAAHPGNFSYECLYLNETAPHISTPLFAVQQMPGVWDAQCLYDGRLRPYLECSSHSTYFRRQYMCVQYPDLCDPGIVKNWTVPLQEQYLTEYLPVHAKPGNGGFFFSCYLGSYWEMLYDDGMLGKHTGTPQPHALDAVWNQISVGGSTMRQAISQWWKADPSKPGPWLADCTWDPQGKPPPGSSVGESYHADDEAGDAPPVPFYTSRFFCNPTCRGFPWY